MEGLSCATGFPVRGFLAQLGASERGGLLSLAASQSLPKGTLLFRADDPCDEVYLLGRGRVKVYGLAEEGKELILWFCFPGDIFGLATEPGGGTRGVYARASETTELIVIPRNDFKDFLLRYPAAALSIIEVLSGRVRVLGEALQSLAASCVAGRVIKLIYRLTQTHGQRHGGAICIDIPITHQEMADMIGTCRQSVTMTLGMLKRSGIIELKKRRLYILDEEMLGKAAAHAALGMSGGV